MNSMVQVEHASACLEKVLNLAGYVPIVSMVSGPMRAIMGKVQIVAFSVLCIFSLMEGRFALAGRSFSCVLNGIGNVIRGAVESLLFLGNLLCFFYDNYWNARCRYPGEGTDFPFMKSHIISNVEYAPEFS